MREGRGADLEISGLQSSKINPAALLAPKQKAEGALTDLRDCMDRFHRLREVNVPDQMQQRVGPGRHSQYRFPTAVVVDVLEQNDHGAACNPTVPVPPTFVTHSS
jgi:hypothetical protein